MKTTIKTAVAIGVKPLKEGSTKYADRVRHGKTKRDHASGAWKARLDNQANRAAEDRKKS